MATRLTSTTQAGFLTTNLGLIGPSYTGLQHYHHKWGWKRSPVYDVDPNKQFTYTGNHYEGQIIRAAPVPINTYAPTPIDSATLKIFQYRIDESPWAISAKNKSWKKLVELATGEGAELGASLGEGRQSLGMLMDRTNKTIDALDSIPRKVVKLRRAYKELRRGNFKKFTQQLGVKPKHKHRSVVRSAPKQAANLWLEYSFGWKPTVTDIYTAVAIVAGPKSTPSRREYATGGANFDVSGKAGSSGDYQRYMSAVGSILCRQSTTMELMDENVLLMNQLGLINPLAVAWELVPFSFVIDWFTKVGDVISSISDLAGILTKDSSHTYYLKAKVTGRYGGTVGGQVICSWQIGQTERKLGLAYPSATWPSLLNYGTSQTRAYNAVSLLTQLFIGDSPKPKKKHKSFR